MEDLTDEIAIPKENYRDKLNRYTETSMEWLGAFFAGLLVFLLDVLGVAVFTLQVVLGMTLGIVVAAAIIGAVATPFIYLAKFF